MGRIRTIKPEAFISERLYDAEKASGGLPLRWAYAGLWTQADREGRFRCRPRTLKAAILPHDNVDFDLILQTLAAHGFITLYSVGDDAYGVIPSFGKHQHVNTREVPSLLPPPPGGPAPTLIPQEMRVGDDTASAGDEKSAASQAKRAIQQPDKHGGHVFGPAGASPGPGRTSSNTQPGDTGRVTDDAHGSYRLHAAEYSRSDAEYSRTPLCGIGKGLGTTEQNHHHSASGSALGDLPDPDGGGASRFGLPENGPDSHPLAVEWNRVAVAHGLVPTTIVTAPRRRLAAERLAEADLATWARAYALLAADPYCSGSNPHGWRATWDYALRPEKAAHWLDAARAKDAEGVIVAEQEAPPPPRFLATTGIPISDAAGRLRESIDARRETSKKNGEQHAEA